MFGADDFLPCLTWVLLRSDVVTLQLDIDYMMELLDPTQLQGEGKPDTNTNKHMVVDRLADSVVARFLAPALGLVIRQVFAKWRFTHQIKTGCTTQTSPYTEISSN